MHDHTWRGQDAGPLLMQQPSLSRTHVVFVFAGDLWLVERDGGDAQRLTSHPGRETNPIFSPDGQWIAFTGEYDGNVDVYVLPATGGEPRRLTYHPGHDQACGWTPDGKQVLFTSARENTMASSRYSRLFTMPLEGGFPSVLPLPIAEEGTFSPDGRRLAYLPIRRMVTSPGLEGRAGVHWKWRGYRGGMTTPVWIADLEDSHVEKIPRDNSNDFNPIWIGEEVYFLSDRGGPITLFAYSTLTQKVRRVIENDGLDIRSAGAGPGAIIFEQFGSLHLLDLESGRSQKLEVRVRGDFPEVRPQFKKVSGLIRAARLSPSGRHAIFEARGELLTASVDDGEIRNLTNTSGVAEREPAWSPDGKRIAYFSDESGRYVLYIRDASGVGEVQKVPIEYPSIFFCEDAARCTVWSPDARKVAFVDIRLNLCCVDLGHGSSQSTPTLIQVDRDPSIPRLSLTPAWSPDSRWLAYTKQLKNRLRAVFVYDLATGRRHALTDGASDAQFVAFDANGEYLYFTASIDVGPSLNDAEMSSWNRLVTRWVYAFLLRNDVPSPLRPIADEEEADNLSPGAHPSAQETASASTGSRGPKAESAPTRIDLEGIAQRIVPLPIPPRNYTGLAAGRSGILFLLESGLFPGPSIEGQTLNRFDMATRQTEKLLEGISRFELSHNGERMLYQQGERWAVATTNQPPKPDEGTLKLDAMEVRVEPRAEWRQIYREVCRSMRDAFYDPGYHGLDMEALERRYEPYLQNLASRDDLSYLLAEMCGELCVSHAIVWGGDRPEVKRVSIGLLGADYRLENGRYRFSRIYPSDPWNPDVRGPLSEPGVSVAAGEYLLAVNGSELRASDLRPSGGREAIANLYRCFEGTAGKRVRLRVGPSPEGEGARDISVVPVDREEELRLVAWIEESRRKVDQMSGGRVGYICLRDTWKQAYASFNRYFFAQTDREGLVVDERFNSGGLSPDHIILYLGRTWLHYWASRLGDDQTAPYAAIPGPKAMIIDEYAGSGGDNLAWLFRRAGLGPLVGKRTWGGVVGTDSYFYPQLIDGGSVPVPNCAFYTPEGEWEVENHGVEPDIEVELDPQAWRAGRDPQLEAAVEWVLKELERNPVSRPKRPPYPNYHTVRGRAAAVEPGK